MTSSAHSLILSTTKKIPKSISKIKMNSWFRNTMTNLYNVVSTPVAAAGSALAEKLQSVRDTVTFLCKRTKEKLGLRLKQIVDNKAEKEHKEDQEEEDNIDLTPQ